MPTKNSRQQPAHKSPDKANPRLVAVKALKKIIAGKGSLDVLLGSQLVSENIRPLVFELVYGVLRHYFSLQHLLQQHMRSELRNKDLDIYCVLLVGTYQLVHMRVPTYAAVNESVTLGKTLGKTWTKPLLNAILRNIARELEQAPTKKPVPESVRYEHPQWMIDLLKSSYPDNWQDILLTNNTRAPMTLRTNLSRISREEYAKLLSEAGVQSRHGASKATLMLEEAMSTAQLPGWQEGFASVQDEGAQQLSELVSLPPGTRVLDACAAPGGKSLLLLEQNPDVALSVLDIDAHRMSRIEEETKRLQLACPKIIIGDATLLDWWEPKNRFDYIILDAPCSGSGTIRRHPDIKLLKHAEDLSKFNHLQLQLLQNLWPTLNVGGTLLYATCSIFPQENDAVIESFLSLTPDARLLAVELDAGVATACGYQLLPKQAGHDGFYFSLLTKLAI